MGMALWVVWLAGCTKDGGSVETQPGQDGDTDTDTDTDTDADTDSDPTGQPAGHFFPDAAPWYTDVSGAAVDPASGAMITDLQRLGWGLGVFQIDWSLDVLDADASTPRQAFIPDAGFYSPDCDSDEIPVPVGGNIEGEDGYTCTSGGDCHLIVADWDGQLLYEMWKANIVGNTFYGGCLAVWSMSLVYPPEGRGDQCTSADAAGYPIAPLLFTADEVASGTIDHAIRFALPNDRIRDGVYFHPASHATNVDGGSADAIPYGARLRLRSDFDMSRIADPDAQVVVRALQTYGMFLADGGTITLMGRSDRHSTAKWDDLFEDGSHALFGIEPQDFEVIALDAPEVPLTFDCARNGL